MKHRTLLKNPYKSYKQLPTFSVSPERIVGRFGGTSFADRLRIHVSSWAGTSMRVKDIMWLALLPVLMLAGFAGTPSCSRSESNPEEALVSLLSAGHENEPAAAGKTLKPGFVVDPEQFEKLHEALKDEDVETLKLTSVDQLSTIHIYRVYSETGSLLGSFEVHQLDDGCFVNAWGQMG